MGANNDWFLQLNETVIHHNDKQPNRTEVIEKIYKNNGNQHTGCHWGNIIGGPKEKLKQGLLDR